MIFALIFGAGVAAAATAVDGSQRRRPESDHAGRSECDHHQQVRLLHRCPRVPGIGHLNAYSIANASDCLSQLDQFDQLASRSDAGQRPSACIGKRRGTVGGPEAA